MRDKLIWYVLGIFTGLWLAVWIWWGLTLAKYTL
jgi:hypothetical protein